MAWYALWKWFSPWRKLPYTNWIKWYSNSLKTPEQLEEERKENEAKHKAALKTLATMYGLMSTLNSNNNIYL